MRYRFVCNECVSVSPLGKQTKRSAGNFYGNWLGASFAYYTYLWSFLWERAQIVVRSGTARNSAIEYVMLLIGI